MGAARHGDGAGAGLAVAEPDHQALVLDGDVVDVECREVGAAGADREPEQHDGAVADSGESVGGAGC
ncbi:hypothetical protein AB0H00_27615 [Nocardia sp. NPDC023852]|uniref:hypothetical protein n=1 Tax=Nocardia sp. NPDC023852 TaxID=3154697 RepID=UPI0033DAD5CC